MQPGVAILDGNLYVWQVQPVGGKIPTGIYQMQITSLAPNLPCSVRVRAATKLNMFFAVTNAIAQDMVP